MSTTTTHPALDRMQEIVEKTCQHYKTDFYDHDTKHIDHIGPDAAFVWNPYKSGTNIHSRASVEHSAANGWGGFAKCVRSSQYRENTAPAWYLWDGRNLTKISTEHAAEMVESWEREAPEETEAHRNARHLRGGW